MEKQSKNKDILLYRLFRELTTTFKIFGFSDLEKLFSEENLQLEEDKLIQLTEKIKEWNNHLMLETVDLEEEISEEEAIENIDEGEGEGERKPKKVTHYRFYIDGVCIDPSDLARVELNQNFNIKRNQMEYSITIYRKFPSPEDYVFDISFKTEEERDFWFNVLRLKLKYSNIQIF